MTRRKCRTLIAAILVGLVSSAGASAEPIVVGQWTWTHDEVFGSLFTVTNSSDAPAEVSPGVPPIAAPPGWRSGDFTSLLVTLTVPPSTACPVLVDCSVTIADVGVGLSDFNLEFVDTLAVASATLSLEFLGRTLASTITTLGDGGLLTYDFTPAEVPEPVTLALVALGGVAWLARRRRACL